MHGDLAARRAGDVQRFLHHDVPVTVIAGELRAVHVVRLAWLTVTRGAGRSCAANAQRTGRRDAVFVAVALQMLSGHGRIFQMCNLCFQLVIICQCRRYRRRFMVGPVVLRG